MYNSDTLCLSILLILIISNVVSGFPLHDENSMYLRSIDLSYLGKSVFSEPDPEVRKILENWNETSDANPEELGGYVEGDIVVSRNGLVQKSYHWKNGVIPYEIADYFSRKDINIIKSAFQVYSRYTCITFRPKKSTDIDYISIVDRKSGCSSSVGRIRGKQLVNLNSPACTSKVGTSIHELMHTAGFLHEQSRYSRDRYVTIAWENIKEGHKGNFNKAPRGETMGYSVSYDFKSIMHYSRKAFSRNQLPTINPRNPKYNKVIGQREGFSGGDIIKINKMYNCPEKNLPIRVDGIYQLQLRKWKQ